MKQSAGILAYRMKDEVQVFLVHPGGPFFTNKDAGSWTIPKGEFTEDEEPLTAAQREFLEETGHQLSGDFLQLKSVKQKGGKVVHAWAVEQEIDELEIRSNSFEIEWPPKSKKFKSFPEVDKAGWFSVEEAKAKINPAQIPLIDELRSLTAGKYH